MHHKIVSAKIHISSFAPAPPPPPLPPTLLTPSSTTRPSFDPLTHPLDAVDFKTMMKKFVLTEPADHGPSRTKRVLSDHDLQLSSALQERQGSPDFSSHRLPAFFVSILDSLLKQTITSSKAALSGRVFDYLFEHLDKTSNKGTRPLTTYLGKLAKYKENGKFVSVDTVAAEKRKCLHTLTDKHIHDFVREHTQELDHVDISSLDTYLSSLPNDALRESAKEIWTSIVNDLKSRTIEIKIIGEGENESTKSITLLQAWTLLPPGKNRDFQTIFERKKAEAEDKARDIIKRTKLAAAEKEAMAKAKEVCIKNGIDASHSLIKSIAKATLHGLKVEEASPAEVLAQLNVKDIFHEALSEMYKELPAIDARSVTSPAASPAQTCRSAPQINHYDVATFLYRHNVSFKADIAHKAEHRMAGTATKLLAVGLRLDVHAEESLRKECTESVLKEFRISSEEYITFKRENPGYESGVDSGRMSPGILGRGRRPFASDPNLSRLA